MLPDNDTTEVPIDPELQREFEEADAFLTALGKAAAYRLESEFVRSVFGFVKRGDTVHEAVFGAICEWDL